MKVYKVICRGCSVEFETKNERKVFCTDRCRVNYYNSQIPWIDKICKYCNKPFKTKDNRHIFCSKKCYRIDNNQKRIQTLDAYTKIRFNVFVRDKFKCVYCGNSPNVNNNVILELDHIIPKSQGGLDIMDNLVTSCNTCNLGKSKEIYENLKELLIRGTNDQL